MVERAEGGSFAGLAVAVAETSYWVSVADSESGCGYTRSLSVAAAERSDSAVAGCSWRTSALYQVAGSGFVPSYTMGPANNLVR